MSLADEIYAAGSAMNPKAPRKTTDELVYLMVMTLCRGADPTDEQIQDARDAVYSALDAEYDAGVDYGRDAEHAYLTGDEL